MRLLLTAVRSRPSHPLTHLSESRITRIIGISRIVVGLKNNPTSKIQHPFTSFCIPHILVQKFQAGRGRGGDFVKRSSRFVVTTLRPRDHAIKVVREDRSFQGLGAREGDCACATVRPKAPGCPGMFVSTPLNERPPITG
jgi:hypothetical protein